MPTLIFPNPIKEQQSATYSFDLVNEAGLAINVAELSALTLTYYDRQTGTIINERAQQTALNANDVTLSTTPSPTPRTTVRWNLRPADTIIVDPAIKYEVHVALFQWTWGTTALLAAAHEMAFQVENLYTVGL